MPRTVASIVSCSSCAAMISVTAGSIGPRRTGRARTRASSATNRG
jgi:hypothetical protein